MMTSVQFGCCVKIYMKFVDFSQIYSKRSGVFLVGHMIHFTKFKRISTMWQ